MNSQRESMFCFYKFISNDKCYDLFRANKSRHLSKLMRHSNPLAIGQENEFKLGYTFYFQVNRRNYLK